MGKENELVDVMQSIMMSPSTVVPSISICMNSLAFSRAPRSPPRHSAIHGLDFLVVKILEVVVLDSLPTLTSLVA